MFEEYLEKARAMRKAADSLIGKIADNTAEVNENVDVIREWTQGVYKVNDVRKQNDAPYKCIQPHDSRLNPSWNPTVTSHWIQYHGTSPETARDFVHPTGAHDMYLKDEYMIWTDGTIQRAKMDTAYSPAEYAQAWEIVGRR